jgi:hypothetical protein
VKDGDFVLIDFERMKIYPRAVPVGERMQSLAKMNRIPTLSRTDRLRFLKGYVDSVKAEREDWQPIAREILRRFAAQVEHDLDRSERRCLTENRDYGAFEAGDWRGHFAKKTLTLEQAKALANGAEGAYRWEPAADAIEAWQKANRKAKEGGAAPVAVLLKRGGSDGKIAWIK